MPRALRTRGRSRWNSWSCSARDRGKDVFNPDSKRGHQVSEVLPGRCPLRRAIPHAVEGVCNRRGQALLPSRGTKLSNGGKCPPSLRPRSAWQVVTSRVGIPGKASSPVSGRGGGGAAGPFESSCDETRMPGSRWMASLETACPASLPFRPPHPDLPVNGEGARPYMRSKRARCRLAICACAETASAAAAGEARLFDRGPVPAAQWTDFGTEVESAVWPAFSARS